jgi:hypothetical protein
MSQKLVDLNPDLKLLRDEGYDIKIAGPHLLMGSVPYVNASMEVKRGTMISQLKPPQGQTVKPKDHTVYFVGDAPCDVHGAVLPIVINTDAKFSPSADIVAMNQLSSKPTGGYADHHAKMTTYAKILSHQAQAIDPEATAKVFLPIPDEDGDARPFKYYDTSTSRAGIAGLSMKLAKAGKVAIIGLGGTGGYVLDFVAKTPVDEIHLYDDDDFHQHNAFRSPGAIAIEEMKLGLTKVEYFATLYSKLRHGVVAHPFRIVPENLDALSDMAFVFLCLDSGEFKDAIMSALEDTGISFIDVGMGLELSDEALTGLVRVTTSTPQRRDHVRGNHRVSFAPAAGDNLYSRNIQVAELNALNAALAVLKWKKLCGFYHDLKGEHHSVYAISTNKLSSEDL